jgi:TP901 family phage tail tape measure protein
MVLDISHLMKSAKQVNKAKQGMASQAKKTGAAVKGMWKQMAVGMGVTTLVASGIRAVRAQIGDMIKKGREFGKEWANVTTMMTLSKKETKKMKKELMALSPTLGGTTELAKGMYQVLSASIEPAKAIKFLGDAAKAAKAGITDTSTAVDAMTTVINAYGMEAEDATKVSDIMFQAVKKGKVTYEELAHSLGTVVPIAATVGVNFKEIAAGVATMTRMGIPAGKATMQLRQVLMSILTPSGEAAELAEKLGIEFGAQALKTKGLAGWLKELREKTHGNVDAMKIFIPNARALTAVMALAGIRADEYTQDLEEMNDVLGNTDVAFKKQMESIDFWMTAIEEAGNKAKIAFFEGLVSPMKESITTSEELDAQTRDLIGVSGDLGKVIGTLGKTQIDELTEKWKHNKMAAKSIMFVYLSLANIINQGQIPTLKSAAETWEEYSKKLKENKERIDKLEDPYFGLHGWIAKSIDLLREKVRWILEDSKSSGEAKGRLEAYKLELESASDVMLTYQERVETLTRAKELLAFKMSDVWYALRMPSEIMTDWDELYNLVETPGLDNIWEQQMSSMEEDTLAFMTSIIPGMKFLTTSIAKDTKKMAENTKLSMTDMAAIAGNVLTAVAGKSKALAIVGAVISTYAAAAKTLQTFGWPVAIPFMAAAIIAGFKQVAAIKAQAIPSAAEGGWIPKPALIEAGHGPGGEVIIPLDKAPAGIGGAKVDFNFYAPIISTTGLSDRDLDETVEELFSKMNSEAKRRGYSINGS